MAWWPAPLVLAFVVRVRADCTCPAPDPGPPPGEHALSLKGVKWPDLCLDSSSSHHFFAIGDWGGVGSPPKTYDNTGHKRHNMAGPDTQAQQNVAEQMKKVAEVSKPEYIVNVGDNFYPGGVETDCAWQGICDINTRAWPQWMQVFENMYDSPDLVNVPWMGVLGNHDYGGHSFHKGWDQSIAFTWHSDRWVCPAPYWERRVTYCDFSIDFYFLDSNRNDAFPPDHDPDHNICSRRYNPSSKNCGSAGGPTDASDCYHWFHRLWREQTAWLEGRLAQSTADWQIVVTHFPPGFNSDIWIPFSKKYGIDMFITGHVHQQELHYRGNSFLGDTAWMITGGGGGITSEAKPTIENQYVQQYGFFDFEIRKDHMVITPHSWTGRQWGSTTVYPRLSEAQLAALNPTTTPEPSNSSIASTTLPVSYPNMSFAACSEHPGCAGLVGDCCPHPSGSNLACCNERRLASSNVRGSKGQRLSQSSGRDPLASSRRLQDDRSQCLADRRRRFDMSGGRRRRVSHYAANCWGGCGGKPGFCDWCGVGNACCKSGSGYDPRECSGVYFPTTAYHTCVSPRDFDSRAGGDLNRNASSPNFTDLENAAEWEKGVEMREADINYLDMDSFYVSADMTREDCYGYCGNKSGSCDFCGFQKACCKDGDPNPAPECTSLYGPYVTDHYECVTPTTANTTTTTTTESGAGFPWWGWLLIVLGILCCLGLLAAAFMMMSGDNKPKKKNKRALAPRVTPGESPQVAATAPLTIATPVYTLPAAPVMVQAAPVHYAPVAPAPAFVTAPVMEAYPMATGSVSYAPAQGVSRQIAYAPVPAVP